MTKLSEAQDAFFAAFAEMHDEQRNRFLNDLEMAMPVTRTGDAVVSAGTYKPRAYAVLSALDALSQAISEEEQ